MNITESGPRRRLALLLGALSAFPPITIDLYLPGMPAMARDLHADAGLVQLSVTVFVVGLALGQAVVGPLSDAHGRRPLLLLGLVAYVAGSLACLVAPSAELLVVARVVQALGAAAATVLARVVARDHFEGRELTRFVATLMLVNGVATVLGPVVGAQLLAVASWRSVFLVLVVVGVVLLGEVWRALPESLPVERRRPADLRATADAFGALLRDRDYLRHTGAAALMFAAMFAYITGSSFVLQDTYGLSPQLYGAVFATNCLGIVALGQVNTVLVGRLADERTLLGASLALGAVAGTGVLVAIVLAAPVGVLLACLFVLVSTLGPVLANATSLALSPHPGVAGTAASLQGVLQYAVSGAVASLMALATHDPRSGAVAMGVAVAASAVAALVVFRLPAASRVPRAGTAVAARG